MIFWSVSSLSCSLFKFKLFVRHKNKQCLSFFVHFVIDVLPSVMSNCTIFSFQCAAWAFHTLPDRYHTDSGTDMAPDLLAFLSQVRTDTWPRLCLICLLGLKGRFPISSDGEGCFEFVLVGWCSNFSEKPAICWRLFCSGENLDLFLILWRDWRILI